MLRPTGPVFNSHAREGVGQIRPDFLEARRAGTSSNGLDIIVYAAPSALIGLAGIALHALTGMAIEYQPFGP